MQHDIVARRRHILRALSAGLIAATAAWTLSGCGPINAGTAAAAAFEAEFAGTEGVVSAEASGSNDLPFTGSVSATVVVEAGLSDDEVDGLVALLADYMSAHDSVSWATTLDADPLRVGVGRNQEANELRVEVARDLLDLRYAARATVGVRYDDAIVRLEVDDPSALLDGYAAARAGVDRFEITDGRSNAVVTSGADAVFFLDDEAWRGEEPEIAPALEVYEAAAEEFELSAATIRPGELALRAAAESDAEALGEFVSTMPASASLELDIQGGKTTWQPDATADADEVGAALRDVDVVTKIDVGAGFVSVRVPEVSDIAVALAAAERSPAFARLDRFGATTDDRSRVYGPPASVADRLRIVEAAASVPGSSQIEIDQGDTLRVRLDGTTRAGITAFAAAVKPALAAGGWHVWLNADGQVNTFAAGDTIVLDAPAVPWTDEDQEFADMLVEIWNAA